ncbi:zinc-dependent alcohol dehydrogenase family protein [Candidatus Methylospira mobilis]|uniref:Zinc-dependent alcohol dehydrogenase family protein n=1 Tax=Candidatus Methylospira mobilis TaxID=1808979 RepID=A0A5Q0BIN6_9GAMM|nr:zinc-dependent alcohol dehydrogenase family protein [Candidatus Methylospira mobilis]QFY43683.1 zinc-dependent alcohol dehydrogenase family protein [Candidatus Methylospira mobilis]
MRAMLLEQTGLLRDSPEPLRLVERPDPSPAADELLIRVSACGVCHTELDEIEGRMPPRLPVILGHQAVGSVLAMGKDAAGFTIGERVGVAWIFSACGLCGYCRRGDENLCAQFQATGRDVHGGYAELMTVSAAFAHRIPGVFTDAEAAPLLCAGAIGYRSLRLTGLQDGGILGLTGFGASAHLVAKLVRHRFPAARLFVFARSGKERDFALELGAEWAGDTGEQPPERLDAVIDTTPAWTPVVEALRRLKPGGRLVINAIRKEDSDKKALLRLHYPEHLWLEKEIKSVANVSRYDVREFLRLAAEAGIKPDIEEYALEDANRALLELKEKHIRGAKVLRMC